MKHVKVVVDRSAWIVVWVLEGEAYLLPKAEHVESGEVAA